MHPPATAVCNTTHRILHRLLEDGTDSMAQLLTLAVPFSEAEMHEVGMCYLVLKFGNRKLIIPRRLRKSGGLLAFVATQCADSLQPSAKVREHCVRIFVISQQSTA